VDVPAIVATAVAPFGPALNSDPGRAARNFAVFSGLGDRKEDKIRLLKSRLKVLGEDWRPAPDFEPLN
jgi:hypothetical protein